MTSRVQTISDVQTQISELRKELCAFIFEPGQRVREGRSDEVVIGGFGFKTKEGPYDWYSNCLNEKMTIFASSRRRPVSRRRLYW